MPKSKSKHAVYMQEWRKGQKLTPQEKAMSLLAHFYKKIESGEFDVETASWWQGMGLSATLRIDVSANSYEDYDDLGNS